MKVDKYQDRERTGANIVKLDGVSRCFTVGCLLNGPISGYFVPEKSPTSIQSNPSILKVGSQTLYFGADTCRMFWNHCSVLCALDVIHRQSKKALRLAKKDFDSQDQVLMEDMPRLYEGRVEYFQPSLQAHIRSQVTSITGYVPASSLYNTNWCSMIVTKFDICTLLTDAMPWPNISWLWNHSVLLLDIVVLSDV